MFLENQQVKEYEDSPPLLGCVGETARIFALSDSIGKFVILSQYRLSDGSYSFFTESYLQGILETASQSVAQDSQALSFNYFDLDRPALIVRKDNDAELFRFSDGNWDKAAIGLHSTPLLPEGENSFFLLRVGADSISLKSEVASAVQQSFIWESKAYTQIRCISRNWAIAPNGDICQFVWVEGESPDHGVMHWLFCFKPNESGETYEYIGVYPWEGLKKSGLLYASNEYGLVALSKTEDGIDVDSFGGSQRVLEIKGLPLELGAKNILLDGVCYRRDESDCALKELGRDVKNDVLILGLGLSTYSQEDCAAQMNRVLAVSSALQYAETGSRLWLVEGAPE